MSATFASFGRPRIMTRPGTFSRLFSAWWNAITRYFVRRAAIASLRALDDHVLRDIGLERSEIEAAAYGFTTLSGRARRR